MTRVARIEVLTAELAFRFSFGHALADRRSSTNVYVRLVLEDGTTGYGEGVPREYVTGETVESAVAALDEHLGPALLGREVTAADEVPAVIDDALAGLEQGEPPMLAARSALELAYLDACGKHFGCSVAAWLPGGATAATEVRYDAVIPFAKPKPLAVLAVAARLLGVAQIKVKVGGDLEHDAQAMRIMRRVLPAADLRVDANAAWAPEEAIDAVARLRPSRISAVEQPVAGPDLDGMRRVTAAIPEAVIADESLRTLAEAEELATTRGCDVFNLRVSKCGGLLNCARMAAIGAEHGIGVMVGAHPGESGLLTAAGRHLAAAVRPRYLEGSPGRLLLKADLTRENVLPGRGGRARTYTGPGLGVTIDEDVLGSTARVVHTLGTPTAEVS